MMRGLAILALGALVLGGPALRTDAAAQVSPNDKSLTQARAEAARARERANALDRQAQAATQASERAIIAAAALAARVQQAEAAVAGADAQLETIRAQRAVLARRLARERAPVARLLGGLQTQVRRPVLLTLLQPGSVRDAVHLRAVLAAVGSQIETRTAALRASLARSRDLEAAAARIVAERSALQAELIKRRDTLASLSAAERIKARRAAGAADREAERAFTIGEQARNLATLVRRLNDAGTERASTSAGRRAPTLAGGPVPYRLPVAGPLAADPGQGAAAVTVLAKPGALVVSPAAGRVAFAGAYRGYGDIVIVEHPGGWTSLVTGLGKAQVRVGQALVAGSPLGQAPARAPRIGLELRRNGQRVDPLDQLR